LNWVELLLFIVIALATWALFAPEYELKAAKFMLVLGMCAIGMFLALMVVLVDLLAAGIEWLERKFNDLHVRLFERL
jgi:RsiW-degrading membrane proteinase PrsW (M82 family)